MLSKWLVLSLLMMASTLNADYLAVTPDYRLCVKDYYYGATGSGVAVTRSFDDVRIFFKSSDVSFKTGYILNENNQCKLRPELIATGMNYEDYNYLMALSSLLTGFSFLFLGSYLVILIARK